MTLTDIESYFRCLKPFQCKSHTLENIAHSDWDMFIPQYRERRRLSLYYVYTCIGKRAWLTILTVVRKSNDFSRSLAVMYAKRLVKPRHGAS